MGRLSQSVRRDIAARLARGQNLASICRDTGVSRGSVYRIRRDMADLVDAPSLSDPDPLPESPAAIKGELGMQAIHLARHYMAQARLSRDPKEQAALARNGSVWLDKAMKYLQSAETRVELDLEAYVLALEAEEAAGSLVSL